MHWPSLLVGAIATVLVAFAVLKTSPILGLRAYNALFRIFIARSYHRPPARLPSVSDLQGYVKALAEREDNTTLYVQSEDPTFTVLISKKTYKRRPSLLILEVRNVDENRPLYEAASEALQHQGPEFIEVLTPRRRQRSRAQIRVEVGTFGSSAIVAATRAVFESVGVPRTTSLLVSDLPPVLWPPA